MISLRVFSWYEVNESINSDCIHKQAFFFWSILYDFRPGFISDLPLLSFCLVLSSCSNMCFLFFNWYCCFCFHKERSHILDYTLIAFFFITFLNLCEKFGTFGTHIIEAGMVLSSFLVFFPGSSVWKPSSTTCKGNQLSCSYKAKFLFNREAIICHPLILD